MSTQDIYTPPFTITADILNLAVNIGEGAGKLLARLESPATAKAWRPNLLRTVYATLALEGGTFSESDIHQILEGGKGGFAPREIQKVRNTREAYEHLFRLTTHVEADLLTAHRTLMTGLANRPCQYRQDGDIAMAAGRPLYMAPPAARLPTLMRNLTHRLQHTRFHPIIAACVFHYELERIHPFPDGNGRLGRLWQTRILSAWNPVFMYVPVDYQLIDHQEDYFQALQYASELADAAPFVNFMLHMLSDALHGQTQNQTAARAEPGQLPNTANATKSQPNDAAGSDDATPVAESAPTADAAAATAAPAPTAETDPAVRPRGRPRRKKPADDDFPVVQPIPSAPSTTSRPAAPVAPTAPATPAVPAVSPVPAKVSAPATAPAAGPKAARPPAAAKTRKGPAPAPVASKIAPGAPASVPSSKMPAVPSASASVPAVPAAASTPAASTPAAPPPATSAPATPVAAPDRPLSLLEKMRAHAQKPLQRQALEDEARLRAQAKTEAETQARALAGGKSKASAAASQAEHEPETTSHQFQAMADALGRDAHQREYTSREIMDIMRLNDRKWFRTHYLNACLEEGFVQTTLERGTTSRNQRYRLTEKGKKYLPRPKKRVKAE